MNRPIWRLSLFVSCVLVGGSTAHATNFAILLGSPPTVDEPKYVVVNPLYQSSGTSGENPLFEPKNLSLTPSQLWQGEPTQFIVNLDDALPPGLPAAPDGAFVFEMLQQRISDSSFIHQLAQPVDIFVDAGNSTPGTFEFGFLNAGTGTWQAVSTTKKGSEGNFLCGTTDHFSEFYVRPVPEPETLAQGAIGALVLCLIRRRGDNQNTRKA